jgi:uncharacterized protein YcgI (DUF1989 family)
MNSCQLNDTGSSTRPLISNRHASVSTFGIERRDTPEPFNIFQNSTIDASGSYQIAEPLSRAGDRIVLRALMDILGAVSACANEQSPVNGFHLTPIRLLVTVEKP